MVPVIAPNRSRNEPVFQVEWDYNGKPPLMQCLRPLQKSRLFVADPDVVIDYALSDMTSEHMDMGSSGK